MPLDASPQRTTAPPGEVRVDADEVSVTEAPAPLEPPAPEPFAAVDRWRETLASARLPDTLLGDGDLSADALDLTHAHPSGLATLMAGRSTRLSSLVREPAAHASARRRARAIRAAAGELSAERGVRSCYLAAGLVTWWPASQANALDDLVAPPPEPSRPINAPLLLRGCTLRPRGAGHEDYELDLDDTAIVNPEVMRRLRTEYGLTLDAAALSGLAFGVDGFDPRPVFAFFEDVCAAVPGFVIERRLVVGSFTAGSGALIEDLDAAKLALEIHPVLGRLANATPSMAPSAASAASAPSAASGPSPASGPSAPVGTSAAPFVALDPDPQLDDVAFDLDPAQRAALDAALAGTSLAIEGPPGTGLTHTLSAIVATLAGRGRHALVVTPQRSTADAFVRRLAEAGLSELVLDLHDGVGDRSRSLATLGESLQTAFAAHEAREQAEAAAASAAASSGASGAGQPRPVRDAIPGFGYVDPPAPEPEPDTGPVHPAVLVREAAVGLAAASQALHAVREPWGVSAYDAMVALAALMATDNPPRTRVRLSQEVSRSLDTATRERLREDLRAVAGLGAFHLSRVDTRWLDARVRTEEDAQAALDAARSARAAVPAADAAMRAIAESAGLTPARTVAQWRPQLDLLLGVRATLDVLLPAVYEQPIEDLARATAPDAAKDSPRDTGTLGKDGTPGKDSGKDGKDDGWLARRGLRRRARALVRPGVHLPDLHARLLVAQEQRARWQAMAEGGGWPRVPTGLAAAESAVAEVEKALAVLERALTGTATPNLVEQPVDKLVQRLTDLAADPDGVLGQPKRTVLLERLTTAGLSDLLADLRDRRATPEDVDGELDLAWWTSVLETIIRSDARLARHDQYALRAMAETLRSSSAELAQVRAHELLDAVRERAGRIVGENPDQVRWLRSEVHRGHRSRWPQDLVAKAGTVVAALRPIWVMSPDAVARTLPAAVAQQFSLDVVAVDDASQVGMPECAAALARGRQIVVAGDRRRLPPATGGPSVIDQLATLAETHPNVELHTLDRDHRTRDGRLLYPVLGSYPQPWAVTPGASPRSPLVLHAVGAGTGVPAPGEPVPMSAEAEVAAVVDLVTEHAVRRPGESLLVVTLGARHAERIEEALRVEVADRPELARWLDVHWTGDISEPFLVRPIHRIAGLERDAVIVSIGLARTPHGRVLHRFGVLDGRFGRACLATALTRSRRRTTLVCCFTGDDLAPERLRTDGARALRETLLLAGDPVLRGDHPPLDRDAAIATLFAGHELDALVTDLRDRLDAVGLLVRPGPPAPDWPMALAVGDPEQPGRQFLAVEIDGREHAACRSVSVRDRSRRDAFERAGWTYLRVAAMDLFCDPAGEVDRIRAAWRASGGGTPSTPPTGIIVGRPRVRDVFPDVTPGRPVTAYSEADLEAVALWVLSDGVQRPAEEVAALIREALHLPRRGLHVEAAVGGAARRVMDGSLTWAAATGSSIGSSTGLSIGPSTEVPTGSWTMEP